MPIDSYILRYYRRDVLKDLNEKKPNQKLTIEEKKIQKITLEMLNKIKRQMKTDIKYSHALSIIEFEMNLFKYKLNTDDKRIDFEYERLKKAFDNDGKIKPLY
jgi:hypothetical protein